MQIEAARNDGETLIDILNRCPGIPPHEMEKVFRPFYRIESSRNADTGGGLGLAIVLQLCTANGWRVELLPRADGGTRARLSLPLSEAQQKQP